MKKLNLNEIKEKILKKDNMLILILSGILLLVIAWPVDTTKKQNEMSGLWDRSGSSVLETNDNLKNEEVNVSMDDSDVIEKLQREDYIIERLETRLEEILASIEGVGRVKVMITLASGGEKIVEKDVPHEESNILEADSQGGNRSTKESYSKEETVYTVNSQGDKIPYVVKETGVEVAGVSVVAQGGGNDEVQKNISEVIQALFGIELHKIKVAKMKYQE